MSRNEPKNWATYNLTYKAGTDKTYVFRYKVDGVAKDLTGYSATFYLKVDGRAQLTRTVGSGITISGVAGTITVALSTSFMAAVPAGRHSFYLEMVSGSGEQVPVMDGTFTVVAE